MKRADCDTFTVLSAYELAHNLRERWGLVAPLPDRILMEQGFPLKVAYAAMERESARGYVEYGVSLRGGWLTPEGTACLASLRDLDGA